MKLLITLFLFGLATYAHAQTLTEAVENYGGELLYFEPQPNSTRGAFGVTIGSQDSKAAALQWGERTHIFELTEKYFGKYKDMVYVLDGDGTATELRGYAVGKDKVEMKLGMFAGSDYLCRGFGLSDGGYAILVSSPMNDTTCTAFALLDEKFQVRHSESHLEGTSCRNMAVGYHIDGDYVVRTLESRDGSKPGQLLTIHAGTGETHTRPVAGVPGARQRFFCKNGLVLLSRYSPDDRRTTLTAYNARLDSLWTTSIGFGTFDAAWAYTKTPAVLLYKEPGRLFRVESKTGAAREFELGQIIGALPLFDGGYRIQPEAFLELEDGRLLLAFRQISNARRTPSNVFLAEFDGDFKLKQLQELQYTTHRPVLVYPTKETVFFTVGPQVFAFSKKAGR